MTENYLLDGWEDDEYKAFVEKFKAKKTTDDCYTPPVVYAAIANWVADEYGANRASFVRPFYPGGDYEKFNYPETCAVVDNPPFSILSKILTFYNANNIRFFLFAPALTLFSPSASSCATCIPVGVTITYENGAEVPTSFVTNMEPLNLRVRTAPTLYQTVKAANDKARGENKKSLPRYEYPDNIITAAMVQRWCKYGVDYRLLVADSLPIGTLDAQRSRGLSIFGNGYLLSSRAAAERAAAERWTLSEREKAMVAYMDKKLEA